MVKKISPFAINLEQKCIDKGLRLTDQRKVIVKLLEETIMDTKFHPDVDEIHKRAVAIDKKISIATVYRTVKLLEEADIIDRHEFKEGKSRYEAVTETHHDHLIDINSGEIIEFVDDEIEKLKKKIANKLGFELVDHRLELYCKKLK
ncbi:MAG: transcriptional repressor [Proteobacteria bacterium]|jgi:Fur family transcriptional regulator, ferric uptake regulator|nr:transcriptional repressor [Pseudomonadota bacterium]